jgi:predicted secreted protein
MSLLTVAAIFFILWWTVLFMVLPLGHRSQQDDGEVAMGTVASAPTRFRAGRVLLLTTAISILLYGGYYLLSRYFGIGIASIPNIMPDFK